MFPVNDPESTKYPDRTFYGGRWMTLEKVEGKRTYQREINNHTPAQRAARRKYKRTPANYLINRRRLLLARRERITNQLAEIREELNAWR